MTRFASLLCVLSTLTAAPAAADSFAEETAEHLRRLETLGFAGVVSIRVAGEVVLEQGYGLAERETDRAWTPQTVSTIGSITKQFTAALILNLQEDGQVRVTDTLGDHFDNVPPDKRDITLHQLLTHTSGIPDPPGLDDFTPVTREGYVTRVLANPLRFAPGTDFRYSNANYSLLGAIAEQRTGLSYEEALRERILEPAGLTETGYRLEAFTPGRVAVGYEGEERWGTVVERPMGDDGPYWALRANGGIHSTCDDMHAWARALMDNTVLAPTSQAELWGAWMDFEPDSEYAYGWDVRDFEGHRVITHNGGNGILFADLFIAPEDDVVVFLQCNVIADFRQANSLGEVILNRYLVGEPYPALPDASLGEGMDLSEFTGRYTLPDGGSYEVSTDGSTLVIEPDGPDAYALLHSAPGTDIAAFTRYNTIMDTAMGRYLEGDVGGFYDAYEGSVERATLESGHQQAIRALTEQAGTVKGHTVLGTQTSPRGTFTLVRIEGSWGAVYRPYLWTDDGALRGYMPRRGDLARHFYFNGPSETGATFLSYTPELPGSTEVQFTEGKMQVGGPNGSQAERSSATR